MYIFSWKSTEELSFMTPKSDANFKEKMTCSFRHDMRNLVNFYPTTQTSESLTTMDSFSPKYTRFELKKYRGVIFHYTEQWYEILINPDLAASKMELEIGWIKFNYKELKPYLLLNTMRISSFWCGSHLVIAIEMQYNNKNLVSKLGLRL